MGKGAADTEGLLRAVVEDWCAGVVRLSPFLARPPQQSNGQPVPRCDHEKGEPLV